MVVDLPNTFPGGLSLSSPLPTVSLLSLELKIFHDVGPQLLGQQLREVATTVPLAQLTQPLCAASAGVRALPP